MEPQGNAWYSIYFEAGDSKFNDIPQALAARDQVVQCIDSIIDTYNADPEDVTLIAEPPPEPAAPPLPIM